MDLSLLEDIGLNKIEIDTYIDLTKSGQSKVSEISLRLGLHRTTSYYILSLLEKKGLVSYFIKSGVKYYKATEPERIIGLMEDKLQKSKDLAKNLSSLLPSRKEIPVFETYEDKEGIKSIWEDILKESKGNSELLILATGKAAETLQYYMPGFHLRRLKKGVGIRIIYNDTSYARKRGEELAKMKKTTVRYISTNHIIPISTLIYADCVAFIIWNETILTGIIIRDKQVRNNFSSQFEILWKMSK